MEDRTIPTSMRGFTPIPDSMIERYGLTVAAVWGKMWRYCQMSFRVCEASQSRIAEELNLSRKTINESVAILVQDGYFEKVSIPGKPNAYRDTGKATLRTEMQFIENDQPVTSGSTGYNQKLQQVSHLVTPPVTSGYTKKVLRNNKDTLRADEKNSKNTQSEIDTFPSASSEDASMGDGDGEIESVEQEQREEPVARRADTPPPPAPVEIPPTTNGEKMDALDMFMAGITPAEPAKESLTSDQYKERIKNALVEFDKRQHIANIELYPEDTKDVIVRFCELWHAIPPSKTRVNDRKRWIQDARALREVCAEFGVQVIERVRQEYDAYITQYGKPKYTIEGPGAMVKWASTVAQGMRENSIVAETRKKGEGFYA